MLLPAGVWAKSISPDIRPGKGVTGQRMLSDYFAPLQGSNLDYIDKMPAVFRTCLSRLAARILYRRAAGQHAASSLLTERPRTA